MATQATINEFLAQHRLAFVGVSRDPKAFSASVYRSLRDRGYDLLPVNPEADLIEGDHSYRSVADLPDGVDGAIVMVPADGSAGVVQDCVDRGIARVWLHKGVGPSSVSDEAVHMCQEHGVEVVDGACPMMFAEPVGWFHKVHHAELHLTGRLPS
jgi:predicted CoA-binding protein